MCEIPMAKSYGTDRSYDNANENEWEGETRAGIKYCSTVIG